MYKIVYVSSTLSRTGPTRQLFNIISHLDRKVFHPTIITLSPEPKESYKILFEDIDVKIECLKLNRIQSLFSARRYIRKVLRILNPDIIHSQGFRPDLFLYNLREIKIPHLMTIRNLPMDDYIQKFGIIRGYFMAKSHLRVIKGSSNVVACSEFLANRLREYNSKITNISNGVSFVPKTKNYCLKEKLGLPKNIKVLITIGSLIPRKNLHFLISSILSSKNHSYQLIILGDGPLRQYLEKLVANQPNRVRFLGSVSNVFDWLNASDCFISTSLSEGLPNAVLEALASGIPCALSDIGPHLEIYQKVLPVNSIKIFKNGDHDSLLNAVDCLLSDATIKKESEKIASLVSAIFGAETMAKKYQEKYLELLRDKYFQSDEIKTPFSERFISFSES